MSEINNIRPNIVQPAGQPLPESGKGDLGQNLVSLLAVDLQDLTGEFGVAGNELALYVSTINGKLPPAAFSVFSGKKLDFFTRLTRFLIGETTDLRDNGKKLTGKELAKLIANNPQLRQILSDYLAYKSGKLRLEASDNRFLSIAKDGQSLSLNSLSEQEMINLVDALEAGALEEAKTLLTALFGQNVAELKKTSADKVEIKLAGGKTVNLTMKEAGLFAEIKKKLGEIKDAQASGAEKAAQEYITALSMQMQELSRLGYSATTPDEPTAKRLRSLENQGIDFESLQGAKTENAAPALKKGDQIFVYQSYSTDAHNNLVDALKHGATEAAKQTLAALIGKSADSLDKVSLSGEIVTVELKNGTKVAISVKELEQIKRLNSDKAAAGAELAKLGYQLIAPSNESPKLKVVYQNTGRAKISAFLQALAPFATLTQVTFSLKGSEDALLGKAVRLHAAIKNFRDDLSYLYTTLSGLGIDMKTYEKYLKDNQQVLDLITNEQAFRELTGELIKLVTENLAKLNLDELTRKNIENRKANLAGIKPEQIRADKELAAALLTEIKINGPKTKLADVITALFEYARSPFRKGLPQEYITLQFGSAADFNNLASFGNFVGKKTADYTQPEMAEGDEAAKKAAETVFNALCEDKGRLFWSNRQAELKTTLNYTPLPLPRLRGRLDGHLHFSDGLLRLISLQTEALPGRYLSDAEALVKANVLGSNIKTTLAPLYQTLSGKTGLKPEEIGKFFDRLIEEKAQIVFVYDPVKKEPAFYYFRSGEVARLTDKEQKILRAFWETSYKTEQQDEKLTPKGKLTGAIDNSLSFVPEAEVQNMQIEKLALQMAALCVNSEKVADINTLSQQDIQGVLTLAYQLLQAGRKDEEITSKFEADVKKNEAELEKARKNLKKQVAEASSNADNAEENLFGASVEQSIDASERISEYRGKVATGKTEQEKKFKEFQDNLDKAKARLELAKFFIKQGRQLFGAEVNGQFLFLVASRVKFLLTELPKLSNADLKAMLAQVSLPSSETYVLTPAMLRNPLFASAANQYQKQDVENRLGAGDLKQKAPDLWDRSLLNDIPLIGRTKINSEQGLYGIVLNHPAVAVLAYLSDELHYDFWRELPRTTAGEISLDINAGISGEFLMQLGGHLVQKYGDRFHYMITAGQAMKDKGIIFGDQEIATLTRVNDPQLAVLSEALAFLNGVYQLSMRKFQPIEGDMLARSFELKDKTIGNRLSGIGRSTFKIPLSGAQKQFQMIISQDILLMKEELGLAYPVIAGPESFEIDHKFVQALLDSPYSSYLRGSKTAGFFGQPNEKPESKLGREASAEPEKFLRAYLAEHPEFSFSLNLGFEDVIDEKTAWAKLLIMKALSNYAVSDSNLASRAWKKVLPLPEADTVFSIFLQQDMMDPGKWNRALNIFLYQGEQLVPGVAGITLKHNHNYTAAQINFLGRKMLETVQNLPEESRRPILEQVNDIFNVSRQGKDKESIDKGMASLEQFARLLADYQGEDISFEAIGLTGGLNQVRRALYIVTRVFLPMMTVRAKGEDESKVVSSRFLQHYRQELKSGHTLFVENFISPRQQAGRFIYGEKAEEGKLAAVEHSVVEMFHLHLFMHPEIMIGLQAGFLRNIGKAIAEGRHGDAVEIFWQQVNTLASFKAFELFPPALIASAIEKHKQGNSGGAAIQLFFAYTAFQGLYRLTQAGWRTTKRARYLIAKHTHIGQYDKAIQARIARIETVMAQLPAKMGELQKKLAELNDLIGKKAPADNVTAKEVEVRQAQAEVNALLERSAKNAEAPLKTLKVAGKQQAKKLPRRLMADKYTRGGKAETRVTFDAFEMDGAEIDIHKRGLVSRAKGLSPIRANNRVVDIIWNAEDLAVEGMTLGGAKIFQNQDMARVGNLLEKMVELAEQGDKLIKLRFTSVSEGSATITIKPSQVVRSFYIQHQSVIHKLATLPHAIKVDKPLKAALDFASKKLGGKGVRAIPGTNESAKFKLADELARQNPGEPAVTNKWFNSVQTQASYCSTRAWNIPAKFFNARAGATRVFAQFYRRLPKALRKGGSAVPAPATAAANPAAPKPAASRAAEPLIKVVTGDAPAPVIASNPAAAAILARVGNGMTPIEAAYAIYDANPGLTGRGVHDLFIGQPGNEQMVETEGLLNKIVRGRGPGRPGTTTTPARRSEGGFFAIETREGPAQTANPAEENMRAAFRTLGREMGISERLLTQLEKPGQLERAARKIVRKLDIAKLSEWLTGEEGMKLLSDPEKGPKIIELIEQAQGRSPIKQAAGGLLVGLVTLLGADVLAKALGLEPGVETFVFVMAVAQSSNYLALKMFEKGGLQGAYSELVKSAVLAKGTPMLGRFALSAKYLGGFSLKMAKGLGLAIAAGRGLDRGLEALGTDKDSWLRHPLTNAAGALIVTGATEAALEWLIARSAQQAARHLVLWTGTSVATWGVGILVGGDIAFSFLNGSYSESVNSRVIERLKQDGMYEPGTLEKIENFVTPSLHNANFRNLVKGEMVGYATRVLYEILADDRKESAIMREEVESMTVQTVLSTLVDKGSKEAEKALAELYSPIKWETISGSELLEVRSSGIFSTSVHVAMAPNPVNEEDIYKYVAKYMQQNKVGIKDQTLISTVLRQFSLKSAKQYLALVPKFEKAMMQSQIGYLRSLDPASYEDGIRHHSDKDTNADIRTMFTEKGELKPGQARELLAWALRSNTYHQMMKGINSGTKALLAQAKPESVLQLKLQVARFRKDYLAARSSGDQIRASLIETLLKEMGDNMAWSANQKMAASLMNLIGEFEKITARKMNETQKALLLYGLAARIDRMIVLA